MRKIFIYMSLCLVVLFTSCQKVIKLKVHDSDPIIVIEALYNANKEEVFVKISKSINVFDEPQFPSITGAVVEIFDENGVSSTLADQGDGTYLLSNYVPVFNSVYKMRVQIQGEEYTSSDRLMPVVPLDSIVADFEPFTPMGEGYVTFLSFMDPVGPNYYRAIRTVNDTLKDKVGDLHLFDDGWTDGNQQKAPMIFELFKIGDSVSVDLISYSEKSFKYYLGLSATAGGSTSSPAPANPPKDWTKGALGHFTAFGYDTKKKIIGE
ncbi:MAG: DUF4249 domain-containing protein [Brumimicrobium sp.]|nr:DUF4249 domain-containing protein [Brumimicrobium sp.]